jgi:hypothetical protein
MPRRLGRACLPSSIVGFFYGAFQPHLDQMQHAPINNSALRYLHSCSGCFRLERLPGGSYTHWKAPPFHGAHPKPTLQAVN